MRITLGASALVVAFLFSGCAASNSISSLTSNPLVSQLTSSLGLTPTQAIGGAGSLLGLAEENLTDDQFDKVSDAIPGTDALMSQAKSLTGISGTTGGLSGLTGSLSKLGISQDQVNQMVPAITDFVSKKAGPDVGNLLASALK
jgi:hypothetical protein